MRAVDLIYAKREGQTLAAEDIRSFITEYVKGRIPDYQVSAFLMAVFFKGLTAGELSGLTEAMMRSGEMYDLAKIPGPKADKHSTGGVGDKVSLVLAPLAAACGLVVPMVSGRGLGHTGGTLDKLEAIPGFNVFTPKKNFVNNLKKIGVAMLGQTDNFVPADKKLYALRDVTATVESIPLISASIMSKKLAEGCESLVLDLKVGNGAFMKTLKDAKTLGETMIGIGKAMGRRVTGVVTDMNQPLGFAVGNANEVIESIECLKGNGPADLWKCTEILTAKMLVMGGIARDDKDAFILMKKAIESGAALDKFREMVAAQGGDARVVDNYKILPSAPKETVITAPKSGYLAGFETREVGLAGVELGGGRAAKEDAIDPGVGIMAGAKAGDRVEKGQPVFTIKWRKKAAFEACQRRLENAFCISNEKPKKLKLVHAILE